VNRSFELSLTELAHRENVSLLAYSPLAMGQLTGKHRDGWAPGSRFAMFESWGARYRRPAVAQAAAAYGDLARTHGLSPAALAIAWCASRWFCASTIVGATTLAQLEEDIAAVDAALAPGLVEAIERVHAAHLEPAV
jgi:aryl-alcohol dehydrogenase-like predicted oxidoreductase